MHLFNFFPRIQFLRDLGIISARQLPVESFLHDACFFGYLGDFWLTLHAVVPLPFFLSLSLSSSPLQPPFIIDGVILRSKHQQREWRGERLLFPRQITYNRGTGHLLQ